MANITDLFAEHRLKTMLAGLDYAALTSQADNHIKMMGRLGLYNLRELSVEMEMYYIYNMEKYANELRDYIADTAKRRRKGRPASLRIKYNRYNHNLEFTTPDSNGKQLSYHLDRRVIDAHFNGWSSNLVKRCLRVFGEMDDVNLSDVYEINEFFKLVMAVLAVKVAVDFKRRVRNPAVGTLNVEVASDVVMQRYQDTSLAKFAEYLGKIKDDKLSYLEVVHDFERKFSMELSEEQHLFIKGYCNYLAFGQQPVNYTYVKDVLGASFDVVIPFTNVTVGSVVADMLALELTVSSAKTQVNLTTSGGKPVLTVQEMQKLYQLRKEAKDVYVNVRNLYLLAVYIAVNNVTL